jgi:AraC family ethanolamine operon transcriptional activator
MEDEDWVSLTPAVLCEMANISERTLQYAFRERFGISPAAFLKARRLAAVRRALQTADSSQTSVGDLASFYGFWHVGQFATDYRRMFGENPSDSLRN